MELVEPIDRINYWLEKEFGRWENGQPKFRVVWANNQRDKRWTSFTDEGLELLHPEVRELPKYQHCLGFYVLEQLSIVPEGSDLVTKLSYEPLWVFYDKNKHYLPPRFIMCKVIIDAMYTRMGAFAPVNKETSEDVLEKRKIELDKVDKLLFGNETPLTDALSYGWGVSMTGPRFTGSNAVAKATKE